jgi:AP-3 complex subunit delta
VNVLCELARKNPRDYLPLAPQLFHLLTTSSNNWMLIKIIKLASPNTLRKFFIGSHVSYQFGALSPFEPRLVKKLQPPITDLISTTPAISLLYECVHTCIIGGMLQGASGYALARTCISKLAAFIQDADQNCAYGFQTRLWKPLTKQCSKIYCAACDGQDRSFASTSCS